MAWKQVWVPNPSNQELQVHKELPEGFVASDWSNPKLARIPGDVLIEGRNNGKPLDLRTFYECRFCEGWIEGQPYEYHEDNLGPLCGRRGTTSSCIRCGHEIGFSGMVS